MRINQTLAIASVVTCFLFTAGDTLLATVSMVPLLFSVIGAFSERRKVDEELQLLSRALGRKSRKGQMLELSTLLEEARFRISTREFEGRSSIELNDHSSRDLVSRLKKALTRQLRAECVVSLQCLESGELRLEAQQLDSPLRYELLKCYRRAVGTLPLESTLEHRSYAGLSSLIRFGLKRSIILEVSPRDRRSETLVLWVLYGKSTPSAEELRFVEREWQRFTRLYQSAQALEKSQDAALEAREESKRRDKHLSHFSHDLRSPLHNLRAILDYLQLEVGEKSASDGAFEELMASGYRSVEQMSELIASILELAKFRASADKPTCKPVELSTVLDQLIEQFRFSATQKGLSLVSRISDEADVWVNVDREQVRRALSNLVSNAIKYSQSGEIALTIEANDGQSAELSIIDQGVGMSQEQVAQLFEPFSRFHRSLAPGAGIGMGIAKNLLEGNGVQLAVNSQEGAGTEFRLYFRTIAVPTEHNDERSVGPVASLLLVDDDTDYLSSSSKVLQRLGFEVSSCETLSEAQRLLSETSFDAVLSDGSLPDGSSEEVLRAVREMSLEIETYIVSGMVDSVKRAQLEALGAKGVYLKPLDFVSFAEQLRSSYRQRKAA